MHRFARLAAPIIGLLALVSSGMGVSAAAASSRPSSLPVAQAKVGPGYAHHPLWLKVRGYDAHGRPIFASSSPPSGAYTPSQIKSYLGLQGTGSGETIAIVDAYGSPDIQSDLTTFDSQFGLAAPPRFTIATPQGSPSKNAGWALETSLDVEWAHAVAPQANILLVEAASSSTSNLFNAIRYAGSQAGVVVVSNSWGESEFSGETSYDSYCNLGTAVCTFSSGDSGNPGSYPAYNPYVVAVGGTTLHLNSNGSVSSETAWSSSGGGVSQYEAKPSYQAKVDPYAYRGNPDVSYDADPNTGFAVYDSVRYQGQQGWFQVGGTSAGAPQWAAIIAVADQERGSSGPLTGAGYQADGAIYGLTSGLADITSGSNGSCGSICDAGPGYDFVTGLGSPRPGIDTALSGGGTVNQTYSATLSPSSQSSTVSPGASATYTYTLTNTGSGQDTFALSASSQSGWTASVSPASVTLGAGASTSVTMSVTAASSGSDTETLSVTDANSSAALSTATATTTVSSSSQSTSSSLQPVSWNSYGGKNHDNNVQFTLALDDNLGNPVAGATVSVALTLPDGTVDTSSGSTGSNGEVTFTLRNAPTGSYSLNVTSVSATPAWDGVQPSNETYTKP